MAANPPLRSGVPAAFARVAAAVALAVSSACVSDVVGPTQTLWSADLEGGLEHPLVTGSAAAVTTDRVTAASIAVEGLPEGTYPWRIRQGGCMDPGDLIGIEEQYPDLVVAGGVDDAPSVDTTIGGAMVPGERYHVQVLDSATDQPAACGDFERQ